MTRSNTTSDFSVAHALARIGLGINIALHGLTRIPRFGEFQTYLRKEFATAPLPSFLVEASAYGIVAAESIIGLLLLLGFCLRPALVAGSVLMWTLLFGVCLVQNWNAAGSQMIYLAFFTLLLATVRFDRFSVDGLRAR